MTDSLREENAKVVGDRRASHQLGRVRTDRLTDLPWQAFIVDRIFAPDPENPNRGSLFVDSVDESPTCCNPETEDTRLASKLFGARRPRVCLQSVDLLQSFGPHVRRKLLELLEGSRRSLVR